MARTEIEVEHAPFQGTIQPTDQPADATNGMMFLNDGQTVFIVNNNSSSDVTVTVVSERDEAGRYQDQEIVINNNSRVFNLMRQFLWNQRASDIGKVYVDFSADTDVYVQCVKFQF